MRIRIATLMVTTGLALPAPLAAAQNWVNYQDQTSTRLVALPGVGSTDPDEKDYIWGDLDQDGDVDLICVRKQPWDTTGRRRNVLFMNEGVADGHAINGILVDRTVEYASMSDVTPPTGDNGFLTPTNDRDVKLLDVNGDGWLDIITAVTLSDGQPKHISHPRVYINQGLDARGNWLGFMHEDARIPQLAGNAPNGFPHAPRFNNVAVGDVNGDGAPDLYFADGDFGLPAQTLDFNNRLLANVNGFFVDITADAIPAASIVNGTGSTSAIADLNLDGAPDLLRQAVTNPGQGVWALYNQPSPENQGVFGSPVAVNQFAPTDLSIGDLNNDGKPDLVLTDDGVDRILIHNGLNASGNALFIAQQVSFETGSDDGFGGESVIADLDHDGFKDVIITDVDFDIPGCTRRAHIYRNLGNVPNVTLQEQSPSVIPVNMLTGTHDAAVFDINGDGWRDIVLGRCSGTSIWIHQPTCPGNIAGAGSAGGAGLAGEPAIDVDDLLGVINAWGQMIGPADVDQNGVVNVDDLLDIINAWGPCGS